jgi:ribosomal protein S6--L-glutamate ligase
MGLTIGVISIRGEDFHPTKRLTEAAARHGHRVAVMHPYRLWPGVQDTGPVLVGVDQTLPDAVLPRQGAEIGNTCLPLVRHLEQMGAVVINRIEAIEIARNQFSCLQVLGRAGLPVPRTLFINDEQGLVRAAALLAGHPLVAKPVNGRQGEGVFLLDPSAPDMDAVRAVLSAGNGMVLQEFVPPTGRRDYRALVIGGALAGAMSLSPRPGDFRANYHLTGKAEPVSLPPELEHLAVSAAAAVHQEISGVDMMVDADGRPVILEVNYSPGFRGLEAATGTDIAAAIIGYVEHRAMRHRQHRSG